MVITIQSTEPLPTGEYRVKVAELTTVEGRYGEQLRWRLQVVQGDYAGRLLTAFCNPSGNPASKCGRWVAALLGRSLQTGEQIELATLVGKEARAVVIVKVAADGREVNAVQELLPLRSRSGSPTLLEG